MNLIKFEGTVKIDIKKIQGNPYDILGVSKDAVDAEIERAYKHLAAKYHPDAGSGNEEYFLLIGVAKACLLNPTKRALYDEYNIFGNETTQRVYRESNSPHLEYTDIKASMAQGTQRAIEDTGKKMTVARERIEKHNKVLDRISSTGKKGCRLTHLLKSQIDVSEKQTVAEIGGLKRQVLIMEEAMDILKEFECTVADLPQSQEEVGDMYNSLLLGSSSFGIFRQQR